MDNKIQTIWNDLQEELYAFIFSKVQNEEVSKDLVHDTFLKAHLNIHQVKDCSKLTPWIFQITRNIINDHFRATRHFSKLEDLELPVEKEPSFQKMSNCINSKIELLPNAYQEALVLATFKNLKQTELAEYLGISYSGAKSRVQRAKGKLKDLVAACENVEIDSKGNIIGHNLDS